MLNSGCGDAKSLIATRQAAFREIGHMTGVDHFKTQGRENKMRNNDFYLKLSQAAGGAGISKSSTNTITSPSVKIQTSPMPGTFQWGKTRA